LVVKRVTRRRPERALARLRDPGKTYPMNLFARPSVDLSQRDTVKAVGTELTCRWDGSKRS